LIDRAPDPEQHQGAVRDPGPRPVILPVSFTGAIDGAQDERVCTTSDHDDSSRSPSARIFEGE
jgi:hypothetical protein